MSENIIDKIKNFKKKKSYLYKKITAYLKKANIDLLKYNDDSSRAEIFQKIAEHMEDFSIKNGISFVDCEINNFKVMHSNLNNIISWHNFNLNKNDFRKYHLTLLKDLLFVKKDNKEISTSFDINNENINENITVNDFILNYTFKAIEIIFNKTFSNKDSENLKNIYLNFIFKINEPKVIIKLKILTYEYLYQNKIDQFISNSPKFIINNEKFNNNLKDIIIKYGEFEDIDIKEVSQEVISFFNEEKKDIEESLNFFTHKNIENNFKKTKSQNIRRESIIINELKYNDNNLHLFSPQFLISNGLKSKLEYSDFEIFNENNYGVDIFIKYITEIIEKINESIDNNNFSNDFIKNNLIKLYKSDFNNYIAGKLNYNHIKELRNSNIKEIKVNDFIKVQVNNYKLTKEGNNNKSESNNSIDIKKSDSDIISISNLSKSLLSDFNKKYSDYFEDLINYSLTSNIKKDFLILLPNILFMLNLKIPILNKDKNLMEFKSVHLDCFNPKKKGVNNNYLYGCKEIDSIFINKSETLNKVLNSEYFFTNLTYIREKNTKDFIFIDENDFSIKPNSIFFCEIKKSFPNCRKGNEDVLNIMFDDYDNFKNLKTYILDYIEDNNPLYPYYEQLIKLIKKFKYFFQTFKDKIDNEKEINIQIVFLYDSRNMNTKEIDFPSIKEFTKKILNKYGWRIDYTGNVSFKLVFFDNLEYDIKKGEENKKMKEELKEKDNQLKEKGNKIKEKDNQLKEKGNQIKEKDNQLEEKDNQIKEKDNQIKEKENQIKEKENQIKEKDNQIKEKDNQIKEKDNQIEKNKIIFNAINKINLDENMTPEEKLKRINELTNQICF